MLKSKTYIVYNVSTLGTSSRNDWKEIIELGAYKLRFEGDKTKILGEFHTLVYPVGHVYDASRTRYLHIDENDFQDAPTYEEAIHEFIRWSGRDSVFVSWDTSMLTILSHNNQMNGIYDFPRLMFMSLQEEFRRFRHQEYDVTLPEAMSQLRILFYGSRFSPMAQSYNMIAVMQVIWGVNQEIVKEKEEQAQVIDVEYREQLVSSTSKKEEMPRKEEKTGTFKFEWQESDAMSRLRKERAQRNNGFAFC